ncbi:MAG: PQQ-binding-like beta-propeller repeat protein [Acidobacteriota bacterium]
MKKRSNSMMRLPLFSVPILCAALAGSLWAEDWPGFLGPQRDGQSAEKGLLRSWPESGPQVLWHRAAGEGYAAPAVADGKLFFFERIGDTARLVALDAKTGRELWTSGYPSFYEDAFEYSNGPRAAPLVEGDRVWVFGVDGRLRCHSVADGKVIWERDTAEEFGVVTNFFGVASSPAIEGDLLLVPIGGSPKGDWNIHEGKVDPDGSGLVAFDKATGREVWRAFDELASYASPSVRTLRGGRVGVHLARDALLLFEPSTGRMLDRFPFRARKVYSVNGATPLVDGEEIFITESYELGGALLRVTGDAAKPKMELVWRDPPRRSQSLASHWATPVLRDGILYGSSGEKSPTAELRAVRWSDGEVLWSQRGLRRSSLTAAGDLLFVLSEYGQLHLVEATPSAYRELASAKLVGDVEGRSRDLLRYPAWAAPVLSNGVLYLRGKDRLVAVKVVP